MKRQTRKLQSIEIPPGMEQLGMWKQIQTGDQIFTAHGLEAAEKHPGIVGTRVVLGMLVYRNTQGATKNER